MRAAVIRSYNSDLSLESVADPVCEADGVVLKVLACGICRSDWHGWVGEHPRVKPGAIPGHEYCGEGGEGGPYAEYVSAPHAHNLARLPDSLTPALAAGLGCRVTTAWHALTGRAALQAGEWLAGRGTGGIGLSVLLIGRALGARVIVVDVVPERLDHALSLGAEIAIDARDGEVAARIAESTGGGAHVSVEALGIEATTNGSIECLRPLGRHVQVGLPTGHTARMNINMNAVYMKQLALYGTRGMPSWRYPSLLTMIETGRIDVRPIVARQVALSDASAELRAFNAPMPPGVAVITDFTR